MAEETMTEGVDYCGLEKTSHNDFCLATLERLVKDFLVGSYLVIYITPRVTGDRPLMAIGYKYKSGKVLGFIDTEGSGSTEPDYPFLSRFPEIIMFLFAPLFVLTC